MGSVWSTLLAIGVPSAIFGGLVSFYFRRIEKKMDKDRAEREAKEAAREESELFQIKMLSATAKLCEFTTIPFQEYAKENQKPLAVIGGDI